MDLLPGIIATLATVGICPPGDERLKFHLDPGATPSRDYRLHRG